MGNFLAKFQVTYSVRKKVIIGVWGHDESISGLQFVLQATVQRSPTDFQPKLCSILWWNLIKAFLHYQILPGPTQLNLLWNYLTPIRPALSLPYTTLNVIGFFDMEITNIKNVPNIKLKQMQMYQHIGNAANNSFTMWKYKQWMVSQQCFMRLRFDVWYLWCDICLFVSARVYSFCYLMNIIACIKNDELD